MSHPVESKGEQTNLEKIAETKSKLKQVSSEVKKGKQGGHYDTNFFVIFTERFDKVSEKLPEESKATTVAIEKAIKIFRYIVIP